MFAHSLDCLVDSFLVATGNHHPRALFNHVQGCFQPDSAGRAK
jgi:hypothetical protein